MAKQQRRIAEPIREYQGEKDAALLVNWFNITTDKKGRERIINVVDLYLNLYWHRTRMKSSISVAEDGTWRVLKKMNTPDERKKKELEKALDQALSYYRMTPAIHLVGPTGEHPGVMTEWRTIPGSKLERDMRRAAYANEDSLSHEDSAKPGSHMGEIGALKIALELIDSGLLFKISRCRCGKFFFLKFVHQRFCSQKCRIAEFQGSEVSRKRRNEYARMLYHRHKALDEGKGK
jgi:hypothetical protein